jgi:hypothetical protein
VTFVIGARRWNVSHLIQGNQPISGAYCKSLYSIYSGDFYNMITVLHHIVFSLLLLQFFLTSVPSRPGIGTFSNPVKQASRSCLTINDSYNYKTSVFVPEGCGLINYIFIVVFLLVNHSTYLLLFSNRGSPFILNVIIQFFVLHRFCLLSTNQNTLILLFITNREINTLDIEYKSSLLRGNG